MECYRSLHGLCKFILDDVLCHLHSRFFVYTSLMIISVYFLKQNSFVVPMDYVDFLKSIVELFCAVGDQGGELAHVFKVRGIEADFLCCLFYSRNHIIFYVSYYHSAWIEAGITSFLSSVAA